MDIRQTANSITHAAAGIAVRRAGKRLTVLAGLTAIAGKQGAVSDSLTTVHCAVPYSCTLALAWPVARLSDRELRAEESCTPPLDWNSVVPSPALCL